MHTGDKRLHARIYGRVQGVSFRYNTLQTANRLGVRGWVRNRPDGSVEVMAEGAQGVLEALVEFLNTGPIGAYVRQVDVEWSAAIDEFEYFQVR